MSLFQAGGFPGKRIFAALLWSCLTAAAWGKTLQVGPGHPFVVPSQAAARAADGDTVVIEPGTYTDCAVWRASRLTIRAHWAAPGTIITGPVCAGRGLFVLSGRDITIRGLTFVGARGPFHNAAGILSDLELPVLLPVLDRMKEAKVSSILAAMPQERARQITAELAQLRARANAVDPPSPAASPNAAAPNATSPNAALPLRSG